MARLLLGGLQRGPGGDVKSPSGRATTQRANSGEGKLERIRQALRQLEALNKDQKKRVKSAARQGVQHDWSFRR